MYKIYVYKSSLLGGGRNHMHILVKRMMEEAIIYKMYISKYNHLKHIQLSNFLTF